MRKLKKALKKIFCLPPIAVVLIAVPSFVFVFIMLGIGEHSVLSYIAYGLSAYAFVIAITGMPSVIRAIKSCVKNSRLVKKLHEIPLIRRFFDDIFFRMLVSLLGGSAINFAYIFMNLYSGIHYRSLWFMALAFYYEFLTITRFILLWYMRRGERANLKDEWMRYRLTGVIILLLNQALAVIVTLVVVQNKGFEYGGYLIYIMAMYAFYSIISAVINLVKFRKRKSPVLSAAKVINLVTAFVSVLSLETAMISQFDVTRSKTFRQTMTACTGFVICGFVLAMSIFMIIKSSKKLKELMNNGQK